MVNKCPKCKKYLIGSYNCPWCKIDIRDYKDIPDFLKNIFEEGHPFNEK